MSSSYINFSSPSVRKMVHADITMSGTPNTATAILTPPALPIRRTLVFIQNKSATANVTVIFDSVGAVGILVPPLSNINLDNYNGTVRCSSSVASTVVHLAYAQV